MSSLEYLDLNPLHSKTNKCKVLLSRVYYSKYMQFMYIILIICCIFDLIWAITHYSSYPNEAWTLIMDLILNIIILLDTCLRWFMCGCKNFCDCSQNWIEIIVALLAFPEVIFLLVYIFVTKELSDELEITSIALWAAIVLLRPIVFCKRQTRTKVPSIYLPNSVIVQEQDEIKVTRERRIDSIECDTNSFTMK
jgi:small-conductance mechanosensitive channel